MVKQLSRHIPLAIGVLIATLVAILVGMLTEEIKENPAKRFLGSYYVPAIVVGVFALVFVAEPSVSRWRERRAARRAVAPSSHTPIKDFFERREYIEQLLKALRPREDGAVVVLIWGMSDVGKTELAWYAMRHPEIAAAYPDGPLPLDLHGIDPVAHPREIGEALREVLSKLGVDPARYNNSDLTDLFDLYRSELKGRRLLIVLDNLDEHISKWKDLIYEEAAGCAFLITSQTHLTLPPHTSLIKLEPFGKSEAARFLAHVARKGGGRSLDIDEELADEICRLCGYLPLTMRMAVEAMRDSERPDGPAAFARELSREFDRALSRGVGGLETKIAITLSYKLLPPEAQRTLRLLNLFQSPFDAEAEEAVAQDPDNAHLKKLERRSMVLFNEHTRRYRLHKLVRDFTAPLLEADERRRAAARYAWYARRKIRAAQHITEREQIEAEIVHLETALRVCDDLRAGSRIELPVLRTACLRRLCGAYSMAGRLRQALACGEQALEGARAAKLRRVEAQGLIALGAAMGNMGDYSAAGDCFRQSLSLSRELGEPFLEADSLSGLATTYGNIDENDESVEYYEQAISLARAKGFGSIYFECVAGIGIIFHNRGQYERVIQTLTPALEYAREHENVRQEAELLSTLGPTYLHLGKPDLAIEYIRQALEISLASSNLLAQTENLRWLGIAHRAKDAPDKAVYYLRRALDIAQTAGSQSLVAHILESLGDISREKSPVTAVRYYKHALRVGKASGILQLMGSTLYSLSRAYVRMGNRPAALSYAKQALETFQKIDATNNLKLPKDIGRVRELINKLEEGVGRIHSSDPDGLLERVDWGGDDLDSAVRYSREEADEQIRSHAERLAHFQDIGSKDGMATVELELSLLYGELGRWQVSLEHAQRAEEFYEELEQRRPTQEVREDLTRARLQAALAEVELTPPGAQDEDEG